VFVSVKDNGIGIPAETLGNVFEMFTQVDRTLDRTRDGLGIGLTLVRHLTEMHGGSVEARSDGLDQGSEFIVRLPVMVEPRIQKESSPSANGHDFWHQKKLRILVVDDNRDAADSMTMILRRIMGHEIETAYDGHAGVEAAKWFRPHIALLDIGMPKVDGYEACRRIREQPGGKNITLVALTGWGQDEDRRRTLDAGFDVHLLKPADCTSLEKLLASLESQHRE